MRTIKLHGCMAAYSRMTMAQAEVRQDLNMLWLQGLVSANQIFFCHWARHEDPNTSFRMQGKNKSRDRSKTQDRNTQCDPINETGMLAIHSSSISHRLWREGMSVLSAQQSPNHRPQRLPHQTQSAVTLKVVAS